MPLALAMSVNVLFIAGLVFIPQLWTVVEYLLPLAITTFLYIGYIALSYIANFLVRVLTKGGLFDVTAYDFFAQLLPAFALAMVGIGLSAPSAMSTSDADMLMFLTKALAIQFTFFGLGLVVLLCQGYFKDFVFDSKTSPGSYALVCPASRCR